MYYKSQESCLLETKIMYIFLKRLDGIFRLGNNNFIFILKLDDKRKN